MDSLDFALLPRQGSCTDGTYVVHTEPSAWTQALQRYRHDYYHLADYAFQCAASEVAQALALEIRLPRASLFVPMLIRGLPEVLQAEGFDAYTPYGYSGPLVAAEDAAAVPEAAHQGLACVREALHGLGICSLFIRWHPLLTPVPERLPEGVFVCLHQEIVVIDLTKPDDVRWQEVRRNHRQNIERLRKEGYHAVMDDTPAAITTFAGMYRRTMQRVCAADYYYFSEDHILQLMRVRGAEAHLCLVLRGDEAVCGGLFVAGEGTLTCHLSATETAFLPHSPAKLMFWEASCWGRRQGHTTLNIGGGVGGRTDSPLFRFKEGFSPDRRFFDALGVVCDMSRYADLCERALRLGDVAAPDGAPAYFPAYSFLRSRLATSMRGAA